MAHSSRFMPTARSALLILLFLLSAAGCSSRSEHEAPAQTSEPTAVETNVPPKPAPAPAPTPAPAPAPVAGGETPPAAVVEPAPMPEDKKSATRPPRGTKTEAVLAGLTEDNEAIEPGAAAPAAPASDLATWIARVSAPERMRIPGPPQLMRVWIGAPQYRPETQAGTRTAEASLPAISRTVRITPIAPGMEINPPESACETIHDTGSEVAFELKAKERGTYTVGAQVALYENPDCSGPRIPKTTNTVQVEVAVDLAEETLRFGDQARQDTFSALLDLWKEALGVLAAVLLLVFRKRLGRLFGLKDENKDA